MVPLPFTIVPFLLLAIPLTEIAVFVAVGSRIGVLATIGLVIATAMLGAVLLRIQGFGVVNRIRAAMEQGEVPGRDLVHGVMIMVAGVLLLMPGFVTDTIGFLLFIPPLRDFGWRLIKDRIVVVTPDAGRHQGDARRTIDLDESEYSHDEKRDNSP